MKFSISALVSSRDFNIGLKASASGPIRMDEWYQEPYMEFAVKRYIYPIFEIGKINEDIKIYIKHVQ
jgi:hypothetical protein